MTRDRHRKDVAPLVLLVVAALVFASGPDGSALAGTGNGNGNGNVGNGNGNGNSGNNNGNGNVGNDNGNGNAGNGNGNGYRSDGNGNGSAAGPAGPPGAGASGQEPSCCAPNENNWATGSIPIRAGRHKEERMHLQFAPSQPEHR